MIILILQQQESIGLQDEHNNNNRHFLQHKFQIDIIKYHVAQKCYAINWNITLQCNLDTNFEFIAMFQEM